MSLRRLDRVDVVIKSLQILLITTSPLHWIGGNKAGLRWLYYLRL